MGIPSRWESLSLVGFGLILATPSARAESTPPPAAPTPAPAATAPAGLDYGDSKSGTLTGKAWGSLQANDYPAVLAYTGKCEELYGAQALQMQASLKAPAPKATASNYWALNDVGVCYFLQAQALDKKGDKKGAIAAYQYLVGKLSYAQCYDPQGWFWSPADAARKRLTELQFDDAQ